MGAVIPAGVVYMVVWGRIIAQKADIDSAKSAGAGIEQTLKRLQVLDQAIVTLTFKQAEFEESLHRYNSKIAAREKAAQAAEKKAAEKAERDPAPNEDFEILTKVPVEQQRLQFPAPSRPVYKIKGTNYQLKQGG